MTPIQEVFLERHWDDASIAPHHCNTRKAELEAHGCLCTIKNLYTVNGDRIFFLVTTPPHATELRGEFLKLDVQVFEFGAWNPCFSLINSL
jgi:hypothetical protein